MQADQVAMPVRCLCGHPKQRHDMPGFDGECIGEGCRCTEFQPRSTPIGPVRQHVPHTLEQVIGAAKALGGKRARLTAERIENLADELRHLLAADRAKARADVNAREITDLPKPATTATATVKLPGDKTCPDCDSGYFVLKATAKESPSVKEDSHTGLIWLNRLAVESMAPIDQETAERVLAEYAAKIQRRKAEVDGQLLLEEEEAAADREQADDENPPTDIAQAAAQRAKRQ